MVGVPKLAISWLSPAFLELRRILKTGFQVTSCSTRGKHQNAKTNTNSVLGSTRTPGNFSDTQFLRDTETAFLWQVDAKCNRSGEVWSRRRHREGNAAPSHCALAAGHNFGNVISCKVLLAWCPRIVEQRVCRKGPMLYRLRICTLGVHYHWERFRW